MPRPVTLCGGQWADLPFLTLCEKAASFGYDGIELVCWGDHFDIHRAVKEKGYCEERWQILLDHGLTAYSISNHLVGQAICDQVDERHQAILPEDVWGDGDPRQVQQRAAQHMIHAGEACRKFFDAKPSHGKTDDFPAVVNGFTGSSIWHSNYAFPPTSQDYWDQGFKDFGRRFKPILDMFEQVNVNFALEVHPTEIAFDIATSQRAIDAVDGHKRFGFNYDPSHLGYQGVDYIRFLYTFQDRIYHAHMKDAWWGHGDGTVGIFGGHTDFGNPHRYWDFRSLGHGDINFEEIIVALNDINYQGPLSVEWEDSRMDREYGAREACEFIRSIDFPRSNIAFDAQFDR